ncbi:MAG: hypothetical protein JXB10_12305 [Pirellulales bacterium]|nr:hypothetical protein [Pirellulales bacterium]
MFGKIIRGHTALFPGCFVVLAMVFLRPGAGWAGGGPENVFLVVNPQSPDSVAIANSYQQWRQIPPGNVFYLPWEPERPAIAIDDFRNRILKPILEAIRFRTLSGQIDYVVYSCDFPWRVSLDADILKFCKELGIPDQPPSEEEIKRMDLSPGNAKMLMLRISPYGSLTGLTYLEQFVMQSDSDYFDLYSNYYFQSKIRREPSARGFRRALQFGPDGKTVSEKGRSYYLSLMLGVTYGRGNTREEILSYLKRSVPADGTMPKGTIYFMENEDRRVKARRPFFPVAVDQLKALGVKAEILNGTMPLDRPDVQGAMLGSATFNWAASKSTILPGAICENFTSFGGIFTPKAGQTPLSEFLRYGAAGSSGTVVEPRAIFFKFPVPMLQVYYAQGCTLAEAFYQAVSGPYELLIVGDPLCRPWAKIPQVTVRGVEPGAKVQGVISLQPEAQFPDLQTADHFELFVGGSRAAQCQPGKTLTLDTRILPDGWNELRVVAVAAGPIQTQGRTIFAVESANYGRKIFVKAVSGQHVTPDNPLVLEVASPGSTGVAIIQNSRLVGRLAGNQGRIEIPAEKLGAGPVRLTALGLGRGGVRSHVVAPPIDVTVDLPAPVKPVEEKKP